MPGGFHGTAAVLIRCLVCDAPIAHVVVADEDGRLVGIATCHVTFSTFLGRQTLWLDDLYVVEERRSQGVGAAIFTRLARFATERNLARIDWTAASSNSRGIDFYEKQGARVNAGSRMLRLDHAKILALAQ